MQRQGRLPVGGADLYYEIQGSGPAVLVVHGFTLDGRMWDEQVAALRDIATVVRCDLRGFGRSSDPAAGVPYSHSADVVALLDHLEIDSALLVGLSMGGLVVLETALAAPHACSRLVLLDSVLDGVRWDAASERAWPPRRMTGNNAGHVSRDGHLAHTSLLRSRVSRPEARRTHSRRSSRCIRDSIGLSGIPRRHRIRDPHTALEHVSAPTTVVVGALDVPCFLTMADVLARRIPGARLVVIPDCGHMSNLEAPHPVNALLREAIIATR